MIQLNLFTKQKQTHREGIYGCQGRRMRGRDSQGIGGRHVHTTIFKMDNHLGPTVQHMELCSKLCGSLDGRGVWGRMNTWMCMTESLCYPPETVTTLLIGYSPVQNWVVTRSDGKESSCNAGDLGLIPVLGRSPREGQATHSNILAWRIPQTEEPGRLYSPWGHKESDTTK